MMKERMRHTTPCFVRVEDAEKRKELIQWLYEIGGRQFDEDEVSRDCQTVACDDKWFWLADASAVFDGFIDCGTDIELFKALAAMNNENDLYQWFVCTSDCWDDVERGDLIRNNGPEDYRLFLEPLFRKATAGEIVKYLMKRENDKDKKLDSLPKSHSQAYAR